MLTTTSTTAAAAVTVTNTPSQAMSTASAAPVSASTSSSISTGAIAGIAVAGAVAVICAIAGIWFCVNRRKKRAMEEARYNASHGPAMTQPSAAVPPLSQQNMNTHLANRDAEWRKTLPIVAQEQTAGVPNHAKMGYASELDGGTVFNANHSQSTSPRGGYSEVGGTEGGYSEMPGTTLPGSLTAGRGISNTGMTVPFSDYTWRPT